MEELVESGKVKSIGLSNFNIDQTKEILSMCKIKPVCNQIEVNPYFRNEELTNFCQSENIAIVAYAPLRSATYKPGTSWLSSDVLPPQENLEIVSIAKKYNKTPAQVILRWLIQRNIVAIPKSVTPSRIAQNTEVFFKYLQFK
jgi:diketogulonate reductase-like aldo/keto reductase